VAYYFSRQYDLAVEQAQKAMEVDPNHAWPYYLLGLVHEQKGEFSQAIAAFQKAMVLEESPGVLAWLGHAYAASGNRSEALKALADLQRLSKRRYVDPTYFAVIYLGLGEKDQALASVQKALEERTEALLFLIRDPIFESFLSEPRFQDLLRRVGLPQ
jgi:tetratricopeptide (TPR) repeat protein